MTPLEQYLNNATRGIFGRRKLEIREELHNDILERTRKHQLAGLSIEAATTRAIQELGDARALNRGMTGVYMMPTILKSAVAAIMISLALVLTTQPSIAQVTSTTRVPITQCLESKNTVFDTIIEGKLVQFPCEDGSIWFSVSSLRKVLQPLKVQVLEYPDAPYRSVHIKLPEGYTAKLNMNAIEWQFEDPKIKMAQDYVSTLLLVEAFSQTPLIVRITGWENPRISVGKTTFTLSGVDTTIQASFLYRGLLNSALIEYFKTNFTAEEIWVPVREGHFFQNLKQPHYIHKIRYNSEPGTVVIILSREPTKDWIQTETPTKTIRQAFFAVVGKDGIFDYVSRSKTLRFDGQINKIKPIVAGGEGSLTVLRVTGDFSFNSKEQFQTIKPGALSLESSLKR
jgi:hypothetical protein